MTREELLEQGAKFAVKEIKADGMTFHVREVNAREYDKLQVIGAAIGSGADRPFRAYAVACFFSDENGKRVFSDSEISKLENLNGRLIDSIFTAGWAFNNLSDGAVDDELDAIEKN